MKAQYRQALRLTSLRLSECKEDSVHRHPKVCRRLVGCEQGRHPGALS